MFYAKRYYLEMSSVLKPLAEKPRRGAREMKFKENLKRVQSGRFSS